MWTTSNSLPLRASAIASKVQAAPTRGSTPSREPISAHSTAAAGSVPSESPATTARPTQPGRCGEASTAIPGSRLISRRSAQTPSPMGMACTGRFVSTSSRTTTMPSPCRRTASTRSTNARRVGERASARSCAALSRASPLNGAPRERASPSIASRRMPLASTTYTCSRSSTSVTSTSAVGRGRPPRRLIASEVFGGVQPAPPAAASNNSRARKCCSTLNVSAASLPRRTSSRCRFR